MQTPREVTRLAGRCQELIHLGPGAQLRAVLTELEVSRKVWSLP